MKDKYQEIRKILNILLCDDLCKIVAQYSGNARFWAKNNYDYMLEDLKKTSVYHYTTSQWPPIRGHVNIEITNRVKNIRGLLSSELRHAQQKRSTDLIKQDIRYIDNYRKSLHIYLKFSLVKEEYQSVISTYKYQIHRHVYDFPHQRERLHLTYPEYVLSAYENNYLFLDYVSCKYNDDKPLSKIDKLYLEQLSNR